MISILLPTYNAASTIVDAVNSILRQTVKKFELLVLDDGSTDETEKILIGIKDDRLKYHRLPHQGLTKTLNIGLSLTRYDMIARMDADDLCVPWRLEREWEFLKMLPENYLISSWYGVFTGKKIEYVVTTPTESADIKKGLLLHSFISHPSLMCRKKILIENGGYRNEVPIDAFQDYETWLGIMTKVEFSIIPEILVFQRYRKDSLSNNIQYKQKIMYQIQEPYYKDLQNNFGPMTIKTEIKYRGWREYFYGHRKEARRIWNLLGLALFKEPRALLAWCLTMLPNDQFVKLKESRIKFRLVYKIRFYSQEYRALRRTFRALIHG